MPVSRSERLLLALALVAGLFTMAQLVLYAGDRSFVDGVCAAVVHPDLPAVEKAMGLFRWVSQYDTPVASPRAGTPSVAESRPVGLLTPRNVVAHRGYFRENCGAKAWLLSILARHAGLEARELRLCDAAHSARHVVSEIRIHGRWRVFDPMVGLDFRRADGELATAEELRNPALLAANARRVPAYDLRRWQFTYPERLHFEKVPLVGSGLRRLVARLTGRPAEALSMPWPLEEPRLVAAGSAAALTLLLLTAAAVLRRRRSRVSISVVQRDQPPLRTFTLEPSEQD